MKERVAFISAFLARIPFRKIFTIQTWLFISFSGWTLFATEKVNANHYPTATKDVYEKVMPYYKSVQKKLRVGDINGAQADFIKAKEIFAGFYFDYYRFFIPRQLTKDYKTTINSEDLDIPIANLSKAIKKDPNNRFAIFARGLHFMMKGNNESQAISDFSKIINKLATPYDSQFEYYYRGKSKELTKDYRGAIEDYTVGIEYSKDSPVHYSLYFWRGYSKIMLKDKSGCYDYIEAYNNHGVLMNYWDHDKTWETHKMMEKWCTNALSGP